MNDLARQSESMLAVWQQHAYASCSRMPMPPLREHLYWDQAPILSQLGALDHLAAAAGIESAARRLELSGATTARVASP